MKPFKLLVTRKLSALNEQTGIRNVDIDEKEFIDVVPIETLPLKEKISTILAGENTLVFTSKNAVKAMEGLDKNIHPGLQIFCIAGPTLSLAKKNFGEAKILGTASDAASLANEIVKSGITEALYFFCGNKRRDELPGILSANKIKVNEVVVYETKLIPLIVNEEYDGICFFSPSAVESFFSVNALNKKTICFSIGNTTAEAIKKYSENNILTAENASEDAMIKMVMDYVNKHNE